MPYGQTVDISGSGSFIRAGGKKEKQTLSGREEMGRTKAISRYGETK